MLQTIHSRLTRQEILALRGLRFPAQVLKRLQRTGISAEPAISIEYQHLSRQYVIRGTESGGAVANLGAYVGFVGPSGDNLPPLQQAQSIARNGVHAIVVAFELVRVQIFRVDQTCDLLVTGHQLKAVEHRSRPKLESTILFHGIQGTLPSALVTGGSSEVPAVPVFHTKSGDPMAIPGQFHEAVRHACIGSFCIGCSHIHVLAAELRAVQPSDDGVNQ